MEDRKLLLKKYEQEFLRDYEIICKKYQIITDIDGLISANSKEIETHVDKLGHELLGINPRELMFGAAGGRTSKSIHN